MKYKSELFANRCVCEENGMLEYSHVEIEFTDEQMKKLLFLYRVAKDHDNIKSINANFEPTVTPLLNNKKVDADGAKLNKELYYCEVTVGLRGYVDITILCKDSDQRSWPEGFTLEDKSCRY